MRSHQKGYGLHGLPLLHALQRTFLNFFVSLFVELVWKSECGTPANCSLTVTDPPLVVSAFAAKAATAELIVDSNGA